MLETTFISFAPCRVGQHAVLAWIMIHLSKQGRVGFYNNTNSRSFTRGNCTRGVKVSTYQEYENGREVIEYVEPEGENTVPIADGVSYRLFSFEEIKIATQFNDIKSSQLAKGRVRYLTILRDPYNWAASYIRFPIRSDFPGSSSAWEQIAHEMTGRTSILPEDSVFINYNAWKTDPEYRKDLAELLGIKDYSDEGVEVLAPAGRGSSFDSYDPKIDARKLNTDSRWLMMRHDPIWQGFINERINMLSRQIFGFDLGDLKARTEPMDYGPGPYHAIAHPCSDPVTGDNCVSRVRDYVRFLKDTPLGDYEWHTKAPVTPDMKLVTGREHVFENRFSGRGIVICAGGGRYMPLAWILVHRIRGYGCGLPIQIWYKDNPHGTEAPPNYKAPFLEKFDDVAFVDATAVRTQAPMRRFGGWELKPFAMINSNFRELICLDADNNPLIDISTLFETDGYNETGALFWPDYGSMRDLPGETRWRDIHRDLGIEWHVGETEQESGQIVIDKERCWPAMQFTLWMNAFSDYWFKRIHGDKDTFHLAWRVMDLPYTMHPNLRNMAGKVMVQHDMAGRPIFQHRNMAKWSMDGHNPRIGGYEGHDEAIELLAEFKRKVLEGGPLIR